MSRHQVEFILPCCSTMNTQPAPTMALDPLVDRNRDSLAPPVARAQAGLHYREHHMCDCCGHPCDDDDSSSDDGYPAAHASFAQVPSCFVKCFVVLRLFYFCSFFDQFFLSYRQRCFFHFVVKIWLFSRILLMYE